MKKLSILIASLILFTGLSFATAYQSKQDTKTKTEKRALKKSDKKSVKKVPARKTVNTKPATNNSPAK